MNGQEGAEDILLQIENGVMSLNENNEGKLVMNVPPSEVASFQKNGVVYYSNFGAKGDGKTDDTDAIAVTHAFANEYALNVKADPGATYYLSGKNRSIIIKTATDFGKSNFIIDDREVEDRNSSIFVVSSDYKPFELEGILTLKKNQKKINVSLPGSCIVEVVNNHRRQYIRYGLNQNKGTSQRDLFIVDKNGNIDMDAPIIWDFDKITNITATLIDQDTLIVQGGHFTTIANQAESKYTYYSRNIAIRRSNVIIDGLKHYIIGEGDNGAPYNGFISIVKCANVVVRNSVFTGHKTYKTIGSAGDSVSMGSYDLSVNNAINVSFINCSQSNDIDDRTYWGIFASNYSKNLLFDNCVFSRFDAHQGVVNATIRNSILGHMGVNAIGTGKFLMENTKIRGRSLINLRSDYGSTWDGDFIIRNCSFVPNGGKKSAAILINGRNSGQHYFGYTCYMPRRILIENLYIDDLNHPDDYNGPSIFANFNKEMVDDLYQEKYPYIITDEVVLKNVKTASGRTLRISDNNYMFRDVMISRK